MILQIRNGRIIDPGSLQDRVGDITVENGRIVDEGRSYDPRQVQRIDASGKWVVPGLIDVHVHLREPGQEHKETIESGTRAAAAGGFTTVVAMPNIDPCADTPAVVNGVMERAAALGGTRVIQSCAITRGRQGRALTDFAHLKEMTGVSIFTDDGDGVQDDVIMRSAFRRAAQLGIVLCQHSEDSRISGKAPIHDGAVSRALKIAGQPIAAEAQMVKRDIELLREEGGALHVSHISSAEAVDAVRRAKADGLSVSAEVTPHHLHLTDDAVYDMGTIAKVAPPLRPMAHVRACRDGVADGTIDLVATDHAPHTLEDKSGNLETAAFGMSGLEIAVPMMLELVRDGCLSPRRLVEVMSLAPARVFGVNGGTLTPGSVADITIIDPDAAYVIDPRTFQSKGINTPFAGRRVTGQVVATLVGGNIVFCARAFPVEEPARVR